MRTKVEAEATATGQGIALQRMLVEKMPEIIGAAASQLANANVTVLNGADGMGQLIAGLASQATQLMRAVQQGVNGAAGDDIAVAESPPAELERPRGPIARHTQRRISDRQPARTSPDTTRALRSGPRATTSASSTTRFA